MARIHPSLLLFLAVVSTACDAGRKAAEPPAAAAARPAAPEARSAFRKVGQAWLSSGDGLRLRLEGGSLTATPEWLSAQEGAGVRFGPARIARGGRLLAQGAGEIAADARGALSIRRGAVVEHLAPVAGGLEQSWDFAVRPEGSGALEVRLPVEGRLLGSTANGLRLAQGGAAVSYSHAIFKDARGRETAVLATFEQGTVALRVPAEVLDGAAYPAVLDPVISSALELDAPVLGPAPGSQGNAAVATNGTTYLVVWLDGRGATSAVYGTRVDASGTVLDAQGFAISSPTANASAPAVAWNGTDYLVVWSDDRNLGTTGQDVFGARVSAAGAVLDPSGIAICENAGDQGAPRIAAAGTSSLVVWQDLRGGSYSDIYGARVTTAGEVLDDAGGFAVSTAPLDQQSPAVASDGTGFLVVWQDWRNGSNVWIYGTRVTADGAVQEPSGFALNAECSVAASPAVAWGRLNYLVAWSDNRDLSPSGGQEVHIYGVLVGQDGAHSDGAARLGDGVASEDAPAVTWQSSRSDFQVVWEDYRNGNDRDLYAAEVSDSGPTAGAAFAVATRLGSMQLGPAVADGLAVWTDERNGADDVYGQLLRGASPDNVLLSTASNAERNPAIACEGTDEGTCLVVWEDSRLGNADVLGLLVDAHGAPLSTGAIAIGTGDGDQASPAVAWDGTKYVVAWTEWQYYLQATRVSTLGVVEGASELVASYYIGPPATACDPASATCLIAWRDYSGADLNYRIHAMRLHAGMLAGAELTMPTVADQFEAAPAIAWGGTSFLVVWENGGGSGELATIRGARVDVGGTVLDAVPLSFEASASDQAAPAVAWDGASYLVIWQDANAGIPKIHAQRLGADGAPVDATSLVLFADDGGQSAPALSCNSSECLAVWLADGAGNLDLHGARLSGGAVLQAGLAIAASTLDEKAPAIAAGARALLVPYQRFDTTSGAERVYAASFTSDNAPSAKTATLTTQEETPVECTLSATDADGDTLTYSLGTQPKNGTVKLSGRKATYTPAPDFFGKDSFTFTASDGILTSSAARVTIDVENVNDAPVATDLAENAVEDTPKTLTLAGLDVDGDELTFAVATAPALGTVEFTGSKAVYTPTANANGADSFTFTVSDGQATSAPATVSLTIAPVNDAPVAQPQSVQVTSGKATSLILAGSDVDGDALTVTVSVLPRKGTLLGEPPFMTYTPDKDAEGTDSFSFTASDGTATSEPATVELTIAAKATTDVFGCSTVPSRGGPGPAALLLVLGLALTRRRRAPRAAGRAALGLAVLATLLASRPAAAAQPPKKQRVGVMTLTAGPGIDPKVVGTLTEALTAEIQKRPQFSVLSWKDVEASLTFERQKALMGCSDDACLAQLGGALGADMLVYGSLGKVGETLLFQVQRLQTRSQSVDKRFSTRLPATKEDDVLAAVDEAARDLFGPPPADIEAADRARAEARRPLPRWRTGARFQLTPTDHLSGAWSVSLGVQLGDYVSLEAGALLSGVLHREAAVGGLARVAVVPFNPKGLVRPVLALEVPILGTPDLAIGVGGAVGVEFVPLRWLAVGLDVPLYYLVKAPDGAQRFCWFVAPRVGLRF